MIPSSYLRDRGDVLPLVLHPLQMRGVTLGSQSTLLSIQRLLAPARPIRTQLRDNLLLYLKARLLGSKLPVASCYSSGHASAAAIRDSFSLLPFLATDSNSANRPPAAGTLRWLRQAGPLTPAGGEMLSVVPSVVLAAPVLDRPPRAEPLAQTHVLFMQCLRVVDGRLDGLLRVVTSRSVVRSSTSSAAFGAAPPWPFATARGCARSLAAAARPTPVRDRRLRPGACCVIRRTTSWTEECSTETRPAPRRTGPAERRKVRLGPLRDLGFYFFFSGEVNCHVAEIDSAGAPPRLSRFVSL